MVYTPHPWIFPALRDKGTYVQGKGRMWIPVATARELRYDWGGG